MIVSSEMGKSNIIKYQSELNRPLILDGAVGSLLQMKNEQSHSVLWSSYLNISDSEQVINLHKEYISSGADIITTNTFRTNPVTFNNANLKISNFKFVHLSVELAKIASEGNEDIFIAASNPPAEDSYQTERKISHKQIENNHKTHIDMLWNSNCDFILNETQSHFDEIEIICNHCNKNNIPFIVSLFITPKLTIMSEENLSEVIDFIKDHSPIAIGINCVFPKIFDLFMSDLSFNYKWSYYLNCGSGNYRDLEILERISPAKYGELVKVNYKFTPFFVGSCCGSTPLHTKAIKDIIDAETFS